VSVTDGLLPGLLEGVTVLELGVQLSGPYGGMLLADLGADVIKVESPTNPDPARVVPGTWVGSESAYFLSLNRNKRSIAIDLKSEAGLEQFLALVERADVVLCNYRPGVLERLGLGVDVLRARNRSLITCSVTGFGETGPDIDRPGYDYLVQALVGTMALTGEPDGPPTKYGISVVDHVGGLFAAFAISSALVARAADPERRGRHLDVPLFDGHLSMMTYLAGNLLNGGTVPERQPMSAHPTLVPAQLFETADDHVVIMPLAQHFFPLLCEAIERPEWVVDPRFIDPAARLANRDDLIGDLSEIIRTETTATWVTRLSEAGIPVAPVQSLDQALAMPQVHAREMVIELHHEAYGTYRAVGNPIKVDPPSRVRREPAPLLGEHNRQILEG
jgi:crotonobetainyl-CoA:carnitine CoA-transferase CaiB-like acyl-CoA transferase